MDCSGPTRILYAESGMARDRIRTLRSLARDDRDAIQALAAHLPEPLRHSIEPRRLASPQRADKFIARIFEAAEENRRAGGDPERGDRDEGRSFRN